MKYYVVKYPNSRAFAVCCEVCKKALCTNFPQAIADELTKAQQIGLQTECDYCNNNE